MNVAVDNCYVIFTHAATDLFKNIIHAKPFVVVKCVPCFLNVMSLLSDNFLLISLA